MILEQAHYDRPGGGKGEAKGEIVSQSATAEADRQALDLACAFVVSRAVQAAVELGLFERLAGSAGTSYELARATGAHEPSLYRLMRGLAGHGCFVEGEDRQFALGDVGLAMLPHTGRGRAAAVALGTTALWEAFGRLAETVKTGTPSLERARAGRLYDPQASDRVAEDIANTMFAFHGPEPEVVADVVDLSASRLIVDVGGSCGRLLATLLARNPLARGLLFDLPATVPVARRTLEASGVGARCDIVGGNFFEQVPAGGDTYLLSNVLHDWSDREAFSILANIRAAMAPEGRLLIVEQPIPPDNDPHPGRLLDLILLVTTNGRERSVDELKDLLVQADFRLARAVPAREGVTIIEAEPA